MLEFLYNNIATVIVCAIVAAIAVLAVLKLIRDKKRGKSCCGCDGCEYQGKCEEKNCNDKEKERL